MNICFKVYLVIFGKWNSIENFSSEVAAVSEVACLEYPQINVHKLCNVMLFSDTFVLFVIAIIH